MELTPKTKVIEEMSAFLFLGLRFGITGAITGLVFHTIWGNLEAVGYTILTGFLIGFFIGLLESLFSNTSINRLPYTLLLILRTITYFLIILIILFLVLVVYLKQLGLGTKALANPEQFAEIEKVYFLASLNMLYILAFTLAATFVWQLKAFFGKGVLINYLTGRYHKPSIEDRIFMFLDLNDATTIAEKLGSKKYSSLLSDFFKDLDAAFTKTKGRVFQYVGDEVVIIWKKKSGLRNNNCINAYFKALEILENKKDYYLQEYRIFPRFKAALHLGEVTITEIGVSKKEIVYHGDTINTTARLCASVHKLEKRILISKALNDQLNTERVRFEDVGVHSFKGKDEKIHVYGL